MDITETTGIVIGSGVAIKALDLAWGWIKARNQKTEITPQPLAVTLAPDAATKSDIKALADSIARMEQGLKAEIAAKVSAALCEAKHEPINEQIKDVYAKANTARLEATEVKGALGALTTQISSIDRKMDALLSKGTK